MALRTFFHKNKCVNEFFGYVTNSSPMIVRVGPGGRGGKGLKLHNSGVYLFSVLGGGVPNQDGGGEVTTGQKLCMFIY